MASLDLYADLGVPRDADKQQIKCAYRQRAKKAHPDAGGSREQFGALQKAYDVLMDDQRRAYYDQTGRVDDKAPEGQAESDAVNMLAMTLDQVLKSMEQSRVEPRHRDMVDLMRSALRDGKHESDKETAKLKTALPEWESIRDRFKVKGDKRNWLRAIIDQRIVMIGMRLAELERWQKARDAALELLKDQTFDVEAQLYTVTTTGQFSAFRFNTW